jgi:hypothetical protein
MTTLWKVACSNCYGDGRIAGCFEDTCSCMGDPTDPDDCCSPHKCDLCKGKGFVEVTRLTDDNCDEAVPLN